MFKNFFKIILRDLVRDKVYSLISILGLSAGICVAILIIAINITYLQYDSFHKKGDQLYQVFFKNDYMEKGIQYSSAMPHMLGEFLKKDYPEINNTVTVLSYDNISVFNAGNMKSEQAGYYSEASLFDMFSFPVLASLGKDSNRIFIDNNSIAVSHSVAVKFFGSDINAIGKKITLSKPYEKRDAFVSSVFKDIPGNSTLKFDYIVPLQFMVEKSPWMKQYQWGNLSSSTYIEVKPGVDVNALNNKIKNYIARKNYYHQSELFLYKYNNVFINPPGATNKNNIVNMLFIIAGVILVIAAINFVNMATSRASKKGREIGLRKVIGATKNSLIIRFLSETYLLSFISLIVGMIMAELLIPYINYSFNSMLTIDIPYSNLYFNLSLIGLWLLMGFISGIYPSVYLSGLTPYSVIKGQAAPGGKSFFRRSLITAQFVFSALFIFLSIIVFMQMKYITNKDLGVNIKQVLEVQVTNNILQHLEAFTNDITKLPGAVTAACADFEPISISSATSDPYWEGKPEGLNDMFPIMAAGDNFLNTFDIKLVKGRDFAAGDSVDKYNYIINEKMESVIKKSYKGEIIGMPLSFWGNTGTVIGIVKNFHTGSLYQPIGPVIISKNNSTGKCFLQYDAASLNQLLPMLKNVYEKYENEYPLNYKFLDEQYLLQHVDIKVLAGFFSLFTVIAIVISCLGLFGITAFNIQQKTKEVGIRKVLGASVSSLSLLLTKSILRTILIASAIALPVGYFLAGKILDMFVYKTSIGAEVYIFTVGIIAVLAAITVLFQVIKAALANPVKSLKYE